MDSSDTFYMAISIICLTVLAIMKTIWTILASEASKCKVEMKILCQRGWVSGCLHARGMWGAVPKTQYSHPSPLTAEGEQQKDYTWFSQANKMQCDLLAGLDNYLLDNGTSGLMSGIKRQASTATGGIHQTCSICVLSVSLEWPGERRN